jgi:polar amino acid transport system substrate-binding protein
MPGFKARHLFSTLFFNLMVKKLAALLIVLLLSAAQCQQPAPLPTPPPANTPTPALIPPILPGDGSDVMDRLLEKGILRVGIRVWPGQEFSPPAFRGFTRYAFGGTLNGFEVEIAKLLASHLGLELELVEAYPPVIASGHWRGEWDIALASLIPADPLPHSNSVPIHYSNPYGYFPTGILAPAAADGLTGLDSLAGRRVGVFEHSVYQRMLTPAEAIPTILGQPLITQRPRGLRLIVLSHMPKAIRRMGGDTDKSNDAPSVEAIIGPAPVLAQALTDNQLSLKLLLDSSNLPPHPLVVAAVPQDGLKVDRLIAEINTILARLHRQGDLAEIYERWYGQDFSQPLIGIAPASITPTLTQTKTISP